MCTVKPAVDMFDKARDDLRDGEVFLDGCVALANLLRHLGAGPSRQYLARRQHVGDHLVDRGADPGQLLFPPFQLRAALEQIVDLLLGVGSAAVVQVVGSFLGIRPRLLESGEHFAVRVPFPVRPLDAVRFSAGTGIRVKVDFHHGAPNFDLDAFPAGSPPGGVVLDFFNADCVRIHTSFLVRWLTVWEANGQLRWVVQAITAKGSSRRLW